VVLLQPAVEDTRITRVRHSSPLKRSGMFVDLMRLCCLRSSHEDVNVSVACSHTESASFLQGSIQRTSHASSVPSKHDGGMHGCEFATRVGDCHP